MKNYGIWILIGILVVVGIYFIAKNIEEKKDEDNIITDSDGNIVSPPAGTNVEPNFGRESDRKDALPGIIVEVLSKDSGKFSFRMVAGKTQFVGTHKWSGRADSEGKWRLVKIKEGHYLYVIKDVRDSKGSRTYLYILDTDIVGDPDYYQVRQSNALASTTINWGTGGTVLSSSNQ